MTQARARFAMAGLTAAFCGGLVLPASAADDAALVKRGRELYEAQKCQLCHSVAGKGNKKNPLDGAGGKLSAADIKSWLVAPAEAHAKKGGEPPKVKMKSYKALPAEDIDALVAYVQSLK
jgi:mono/diheme cytochrome c family protein